MPSLLLLGASGYVGGSILVALKESHPELEITAIVRNASQVDAIRAAGASDVIHASSNFLDEAERLSMQSDVVINTAGSDNLELASAVLRGLKKRFDGGKGAPTYIHTSGAAVFLDGSADGKLNPTAKVWNDGLEEHIRAITTKMPHGHVDVPILKAGQEGYIHTYIVCPTLIYGLGTGPIAKFSSPVKNTTQFIKAHGHALYVGEGGSITGTIHIDDVVSLFIVILENALSSAPTDSTYARYYIANAEAVDWKTIATATGDVMYRKGLISSPEPKSLPAAGLGRIGILIGSSMYIKDVRARALGWRPTHSGPDFIETFTQDLEELLATKVKDGIGPESAKVLAKLSYEPLMEEEKP